MKIILLFTLIVLFSNCKHPEAKKFERNNSNSIKLNSDYTINNELIENEDQTTSISMRQESGVYFVPIEINGVNMEFIFDTGASNISISETEARFLWKQGKLTENDFIGDVEFIDANGDISEGTVINLKSVKIGDREVFNVKASIVHNQIAPLLFGQTAMNRFGKITIDYKNNEITFN